MASYDAFISYSHVKDKPIAAALQSAVQKLGKPWYRRRALRVFRDDTSLSATPHMWPSIEQALRSSRFFLLLASPEAAASKWVNKEVAFWLDRNGVDTLLLGVTDGDLAWDEALGDFAQAAGFPLPLVLVRRFADEPKWIDLRAYRDKADPRDADFARLAADFASVIHDRPKEDLLSEEVLQQRRALNWAWSAAGALTLLALATTGAGIATYLSRNEAILQRDRAEKTVAAATETANALVGDVALRLREVVGTPIGVIGEILARIQKLQDGLVEYNRTSAALQRSRAIARREISQTLRIQGDQAAARATALEALAILEPILAADPGNPELRREMSLTFNRIGEAFSGEGQHEKSLDYFIRSLTLRNNLAEGSTELGPQRDLALSYERVADEQYALGRHDEAGRSYQSAFEIRYRLAGNADNPELQFDLSVSYDRLARIAADREEAIKLYSESLAMRQALLKLNARNLDWQGATAASYDDIGNCYLGLGQNDKAIENYRRGLDIREHLATQNPDIARWQAFLAVSLYNLGRAGDLAQQRFTRALDLLYKLAVSGKLPVGLSALPAEIERLRADLGK
jgi:tetratricopeptide (TPR) repeat protein